MLFFFLNLLNHGSRLRIIHCLILTKTIRFLSWRLAAIRCSRDRCILIAYQCRRILDLFDSIHFSLLVIKRNCGISWWFHFIFTCWYHPYILSFQSLFLCCCLESLSFFTSIKLLIREWLITLMLKGVFMRYCELITFDHEACTTPSLMCLSTAEDYIIRVCSRAFAYVWTMLHKALSCDYIHIAWKSSYGSFLFESLFNVNELFNLHWEFLYY